MSVALRLQLSLGAFDLDVDLRSDAPIIAFIGPNGSGKSTALRCVVGAHPQACGRVVLGGRTLMDSAAGLHLSPADRRIGYLPQRDALFEHLTAVDNVAFGLRGDRATAQRLLEEAGLGALAEQRPPELSGGQRQHVASLRAMAWGPDSLILDEPTAALDWVARDHARKRLRAYAAAQGLPVLLATHDPTELAAFAPHVVVLEAGRIIAQGTVEQLSSQPPNAFVAAFLG